MHESFDSIEHKHPALEWCERSQNKEGSKHRHKYGPRLETAESAGIPAQPAGRNTNFDISRLIQGTPGCMVLKGDQPKQLQGVPHSEN